MRICMVMEYYVPHVGGGVVLFKELAERLAKTGNEVHVVTALLGNTVPYEEISSVKVHRVRVPLKGDRYWFTFLAIPKVLGVARWCDVIHGSTYNGAFPTWVAAKLLRKPCVETFHELFGDSWKAMTGMNSVNACLHRFLERLIACLPFDKIICPSCYTRDCLRSHGISNERLAVIYNGVDYDLFAPRNSDGRKIREKLGFMPDDFVYMSYGRPGISKGIEYLVRAASIISRHIPNSRLLLILSHRDRYDAIKSMIHSLGLQQHIRLLDPVPREELPSYIDCSNCVVVPSLSEGFGYTAAEACAMDKPLVSTTVGSLPEVASGSYILVKPRSPEDIARGVQDVYEDRIGQTEKKFFTWSECTGRYLEVYSSLYTGKV